MSEAGAAIDSSGVREASDTSGAGEELERARPADATPVARLLQREGAVALAGLSLWAATDAWVASTGLGFATLLSVVVGAVVGVVLSQRGHELGHFAGARWAGGVAPTLPITSWFPIFNLDLQRSSETAFRAMSVAGNAGHWLVVLLLFAITPLDTAGRVALFAGAFGHAISASTTEFPIIRRSFSGASPAESFAGLTGEKLRRNRWIGAAAGLVIFLVL